MSNDKIPPGTGTPLMNSAYSAPYPVAGSGGNYPAPPPYATGPQGYPPGGPQPYPPGMPQPYPPGMPQPYPPGGPQPYPAGGPQPTVIMTTPTVTTFVVGTQLADTPGVIVCNSCRQNITTRVAYTAGLLAWLIFGALCLFGCWLGCCLIPFCVDACKDVDHFCPNCNHHIYKYKRM